MAMFENPVPFETTLNDTPRASRPAYRTHTNLFGETTVYIGHYKVVTSPHMPHKAIINDTRTNEGGTFDLDSVHIVLEMALDTFFTDHF